MLKDPKELARLAGALKLREFTSETFVRKALEGRARKVSITHLIRNFASVLAEEGVVEMTVDDFLRSEHVEKLSRLPGVGSATVSLFVQLLQRFNLSYPPDGASKKLSEDAEKVLGMLK